MIRTLNLIGLKRRGVPRPAIQEVRFIFNNYYRMEKNASQAIKDIEAKGIETPEGLHLLNFLKVDSPRGITKKVGKVDEDES